MTDTKKCYEHRWAYPYVNLPPESERICMVCGLKQNRKWLDDSSEEM